MDIWRWVHEAERELINQGHERLAHLMDEIPGLVVNEEHEKVDALMPEILNLVKKQSNEWVELFFRHWHLQSRVLNRQEVKGALPEAIALLDFAHQETTIECPQSVCAVQDLAHCYGSQDGPGFAPERLKIAQEGLDKINPEWPCYGCISSEYIDALIDQELFEDAIKSLNHYKEQMMKYDQEIDSDLSLSEIHALIGLNQLDEALHIAQTVENSAAGLHFENQKQGYQSYIHSLAGNAEESINLLHGFETIMRTASLGEVWIKTILELAKLDAIENDWVLHNNVQKLGDKYIDQGCYRLAFETFCVQTQVSIFRNQKISATYSIDIMHSILPSLAKDCGAMGKIKSLTIEIESLNNPAKIDFSNSPNQLKLLDENPIERLAQIKDGLSIWPDNQALILALSQCYFLLDDIVSLKTELHKFLLRYPNSPDVIFEYGFKTHDQILLLELLEQSLNDESRLNCLWVLANLSSRADEYKKALTLLDDFFEINPGSINAFILAQTIAFKDQNYKKSLFYNSKVINLEPEEKNHHWDSILYATLVEDWEVVRNSAKVLNLPVDEGEGEINEEWYSVRIKLDDESIVRAVRTGPVTAKILEANSPEDTCFVDTKVVFDPSPLNHLDHQDDEGNKQDSEGNYTYLYSVVRITGQSTRRTVVLDGIFPEEASYTSFLQLLNEQDIKFHRQSNDEYKIEQKNRELTGLYAFLYVPQAQSDEFVHQQLTKLCEGLEHPILWPALAKQAGDNAAAKVMLEQAGEYDIYID